MHVRVHMGGVRVCMHDLLTAAPPGLTFWPRLALGRTLLFGICDPGQLAPSLPLETAVGRV